MRLCAFSIENYRSITSARKVPLEGYTLLVGPNNEGKSNILHALSTAMKALTTYREATLTSANRLRENSVVRVDYDWERDFPVAKQSAKRGGRETRITLELEFSAAEVEEFRVRTH